MARTQSASAHRKVLDAALELVATRGIEATSMDAIAQKSGVSKATIYNHWADKEALLLEMLADASGLRSRPVFDSGDTKADLVAVLTYRLADDSGLRERLGPQFAAYSATNHEFGNAWRNMVMEPPRRELKHLLKLGIKKGELSADVDIELSLSLLLGPILYWHIFLRKTASDPKPIAEGVVEAYWRAFGITRAQPVGGRNRRKPVSLR